MSLVRDFKEEDWVFRRSSGYVGYDHKNHPNNEQKWIYEKEYSTMRHLKDSYETDYKLLHDFRLECLPFGEYPDVVIQDFLNKKYDKILETKDIDIEKFKNN